MTKMLKLYGEFYPADNVAGVLGDCVVTLDNPRLHEIQGNERFSEFLSICLPHDLYCEFCHQKTKHNDIVCDSCGASYAKT